jgi:D-tagatose-1,6-bisphosphate aldolase subunit GatZ/KbaZ
MTRHPEHWAAYYRGSPEEARRQRALSYSDRCRYYWPQPEVQVALAGLLRNLSERPIPEALIDEFLPGSYGVAQEGRLPAEPVALIRHHIQRVLDLYAAACDDERDETSRRGRER